MATNKKEELTNAAHVLNPIYNVNGFLTSSEQVLDEVIGKNQGSINQTINDGNISTIDNYFAIYKSNTYSGKDIFNDPEMNWVLIKDSEGKDIPEMTKDKPYLWNYKQINFIGGSKTGDEYIAPQIIPPSVVAVYSGIYKLEVFYQVTNDSINHPTETDENWKTDSPATTKEKPFLWQKRVTYFADKPNTPRTIEFNLIGTLGESGIDGTDIEYIFKLTNTNIAPSNPTPKNWNSPNTETFHNTYQDSDWKDEANGWYDDPQEPSFTMQYEWICERKRVFEKTGVDVNGRTVGKYVWGQFTKPALWAKYSKEGLGISEVVEAYLVSNVNKLTTDITGANSNNENTDAPSNASPNTWYKTSPNATVDYPFLWKRTITKFKREDLPDTVIDESSEKESVIYEMIGTLGEPGIDGTDIEYIFKLTKENKAPNNPYTGNIDNVNYQKPDWKDEANGWYDDPQEPDFENPFEWICERKRTATKSIDTNGRAIVTYKWGAFTSPALWAKYSKEGLGISEVKVAYLVSNVSADITSQPLTDMSDYVANEDSKPNTWYKTSPEVTEEYKYLWKRTKTRFKRDDDPSTMQDESFLKETTLYEMIGTLGEPGIDGAGVEWVYLNTKDRELQATNITPSGWESATSDYQKKDFLPKTADGEWLDDSPQPSADKPYIWRAQRKYDKEKKQWQPFSNPPVIVYSHSSTSFKSIVFCRSEVALNTPEGGSFINPIPDKGTNTSGYSVTWSDGVPAGSGDNLWMSSRIFTADGQAPQQATWTTPQKLSDSLDMEIIYSGWKDKEDIPTGFKRKSNSSTVIDDTWLGNAKNKGWYDDPEQVTDKEGNITGNPWWMAVINKENGVWNDNWKISKIRGEDGSDGISPVAQFVSTVFCRSDDDLSNVQLTGGSWSDPLPDQTDWTDGIPGGKKLVWSSYNVFYSDGSSGTWSKPILMVDTPDIEYLYSNWPNHKAVPDGFSKDDLGIIDTNWLLSAGTDYGWYDNPESCRYNVKENGTWVTYEGNPWWLAVSKKDNGVWGAWKISKIRGEDGEDGKSITVKGKFNSLSELKAAFPNGPEDLSHTYIIGTHLYVWDGDSWEDMGEFKGEPGVSAFLHIKYASSVIYDSNGNVSKVTLTGANGEEPGDYIGTFSDSNENDPSDEESLLKKYKWKYWKGEDGFGYEYIYQLSNTYSAPDVPEYKYAENGSEIAVNGKFSYNDDYVPEGWFDNPPSVSSTNKYAWVCYRKKISGAWTEYIGSTDKPGKASLWASMGEQGRGISENGVTECYALSKSSFGGYPDKSKEDPTGKTGWLRIKPNDTTTSLPTMDESYRYLWNYEIVTYTDSKSEETAPVLIGVFSLDGVGVKSIINYYRVCNSSTIVPDESNENGMYLTTTTTTPLPGAFDPDVDYEDNIAFKYYPTDGWAKNSPSVSSEYPFLWQKTVTQYTDGRADQIVYNCVGSADTAGVDSQTIEYIYYLASAESSKPSKPKYSNNQEEYWKQRYGNEYTPAGWYDDPPEMSIPGQKIYISSRIKSIPERYITTDGLKDINGNELKEVRNMVPIWGMFSEPELFATYSLDGRGIKSLEEFYKVSNSDTAPTIPDESNALWKTWDGMSKTVGYNLGGINGAFSGWYYKKPQAADQNNPYLWNFERVLYSDGTSVVHPASNIGQYGKEAVRLSFNTPFITYSTSPSNLISEEIVHSIKAKLYRGNVELDVKEYELYFDVNGDIPKGPETSDSTNSTVSTGTADSKTTTTPVPGSAEAIKQTLKGYITCKRDDDESNNQFIITVKQPSGLNKTNRIDTIIISAYGDSDLLVANGTIQALYAQRGEAGPSAAVGKTSYPAGTWDAGTNYKSTDTSTPYVWYDSTKKYYLLVADSAQGTSQSPENSSYWNPMDSFKAIYTEFLMADNANLGSANGSIIYSNLLYSQLGRDENGIDNRHYSVYLDKDGGMYSESEVTDVYSGTNTIHSFNGKFIPNTFIDFYRGSIACNKLSETYSYFNLYNSNDNINYIYEMDLNKSHNISINPRIDDYDSPYQVNWEYGTVYGHPGLIILPDYSTSSTWAEDGIHITITHQVDINWLKNQNSNFDHSNSSIVLVAADSRMFDSNKYNDSSITTDGKNLFLWRGVASKIIAIQPGVTIKLRSSITFEETWINGELKKTAVGRNWIIENSEDFEPTKMYISVNNEKLYDLTVDPGAHNNPTPIVLGGNILSYPRSITEGGVTTRFNLSKSKFNSRGNLGDIITENNAYCFRVTTDPSSTENSIIELAWNKNDLGV